MFTRGVWTTQCQAVLSGRNFGSARELRTVQGQDTVCWLCWGKYMIKPRHSWLIDNVVPTVLLCLDFFFFFYGEAKCFCCFSQAPKTAEAKTLPESYFYYTCLRTWWKKRALLASKLSWYFSATYSWIHSVHLFWKIKLPGEAVTSCCSGVISDGKPW